MMNARKKEQLITLANKRRADNFFSRGSCRFCYMQPESLHKDFWNKNYSKFEHLVSPWSVASCNLDSDFMIVGQDWLSEDKLSTVNEEILNVGRDESLDTNKNLKKYLNGLNLDIEDVFSTNLFPFVKPGNMSSSIPVADFDYAFENYLKPQIKIIRPKVIVALGASVFKQFFRASGDKSYRSFSEMIKIGHVDFLNSRVFPVYHPGKMGTNNAGSFEEAQKLWDAIKNYKLEL